MKILSLFDGISCGQMAFKNIGLENYQIHTSEIDSYAINTTLFNFPFGIGSSTLGDIRDIDDKKLKEIGEIDIILAGSPCTNLSRSGNRKGLLFESLEEYLQEKKKGLNIGKSQSYLFFEFLRILRSSKPKFFLLENVVMKKDNQEFINKCLDGIIPYNINSSHFSPQSRRRLYWIGKLNEETGKYERISLGELPPFNPVVVQDILQPSEEVGEQYHLDKKHLPKIKWTKEFSEERSSGINQIAYFNKGSQGARVYSPYSKGITISAAGGGLGAKTGLFAIKDRYGKIIIRKLSPLEAERMQGIEPYYFKITANHTIYKKDGILFISEDFFKINNEIHQINKKDTVKIFSHFHIHGGTHLLEYIKKLEAFKEIDLSNIQTIKIEHGKTMLRKDKQEKLELNSNTQRYKMIGNGWTIPVISFLLKNILKK